MNLLLDWQEANVEKNCLGKIKKGKEMSDLISRQDAINSLNGKLRITGGVNADVIQKYINCVLDNIRNLPSAEPKWIPCSERLPEYGTKCLVTYALHEHNDCIVTISYCYVQKEGFWSDRPFGHKVIAWMPLPEPYKGKQDE